MLVIRLQRMGKTKSPSYRIIVSEKKHDTQYGSLEILGIYNPVEKNKIVELKEDRIKYWISVGAQTSETVNNLLLKAGVITGKVKKAVKISKKRQAKMGTKKAAAEAEEAKKKEAAEAAKVKAEEEAKAKAEAEEATKAIEVPVEVTPAEEVPVEEVKTEDAPVVEEKPAE